MPDNVLPNPTKGTGILRFAEDIYLEFKYDTESEEPTIIGYFHYGDSTTKLIPDAM